MLHYITSVLSHEQSMLQGKVETCSQKLPVMQAAKRIVMLSMLHCSFSVGQAITNNGMDAHNYHRPIATFIVVLTKLDIIIRSSPWCRQIL